MMQPVEIRKLVREINEYEKTLAVLEANHKRASYDLLCERALQGKKLLELKANVPPGSWTKLLKSGEIKISWTEAHRRMTLAKGWDKIKDADIKVKAVAMRYLGYEHPAVAPESPGQQEEHVPKRWPDFREATEKLSRFAVFFIRKSNPKWPKESLDRMRELLLPVVRELWPEANLAPATTCTAVSTSPPCQSSGGSIKTRPGAF